MKIVTKETLENVRNLAFEKEEIEGMMRRHGLTPRSSAADGMPRGSGTGDPTGNLGTVRAELRSMWEAKVEEIDRQIIEVEKNLSVLDSIHRRIVRMYYFEGMGDRRIAARMHMNFDVIGRKRREAIVTLEEAE